MTAEPIVWEIQVLHDGLKDLRMKGQTTELAIKLATNLQLCCKLVASFLEKECTGPAFLSFIFDISATDSLHLLQIPVKNHVFPWVAGGTIRFDPRMLLNY